MQGKQFVCVFEFNFASMRGRLCGAMDSADLVDARGADRSCRAPIYSWSDEMVMSDEEWEEICSVSVPVARAFYEGGIHILLDCYN
jgi:hypothetical protein